jgi:hypothetical protein
MDLFHADIDGISLSQTVSPNSSSPVPFTYSEVPIHDITIPVTTSMAVTEDSLSQGTYTPTHMSKKITEWTTFCPFISNVSNKL